MRDFCKQTVFRRSGGAIGVHCALLAQEGPAAHGPLLALHIPAYSPYFRGHTLASELVQLVSKDGWSMDSVVEFLRRSSCRSLAHWRRVASPCPLWHRRSRSCRGLASTWCRKTSFVI